jgi:hypothetical protein
MGTAWIEGEWLVLPICATLEEIQPGAACPCYGEGTEPGVGIDFGAQVLTQPFCAVDLPDRLELGGDRPGGGGYWQASITRVPDGGSLCVFIDVSIDVWVMHQLLTPAEYQTCLQTALDSEMFALNDCPPDGP